MKRYFAALTALSLVLMASPARAEDKASATPTAAVAVQTGIKGTMDITFITRTSAGQADGAPRKGAQDSYKLDLTVNGNNEFQGLILRQPRITQLKVRTIQQPRYDYNVNLFVTLKDGNKPNVGTWVGPMAVDEKTGAFILDADGERALRLNVTAGSGFTDPFGGRFYGKAADKSKLSFESIKRTINGKEVEKKFQADPMRFENVKLAKGPNPKMYTNALVNGSLDYDRETSNYYANGLKFSYQTPDGKQQDDSVSGTIKWIEDPARASNGKGHYEFNLRYNEDKNTPAKSDDAQFGGKSDDDLFFAVDKSLPALTGTVEYVDTLQGDTVQASKVTFNLTGNNLTPQQVMNFAKLWMICCGPVNDE